jgi:hypothetical protein
VFHLEAMTPARLGSVNNRAEMHGKEPKPAVDLRFTFDAPNDILALFDRNLLKALYHRAKGTEASGQQQGLEGVQPVSDAPNLRMPKLGLPLKWEHDLTGYSLTIDPGLGGRSNIELYDCLVNSFTLEPKEGGTVTISLRVQASKDLTEAVLGRLASLVQHDVSILLDPPEVAQEQLAETPPPGKPRTKRGKDATDAFIATQGNGEAGDAAATH